VRRPGDAVHEQDELAVVVALDTDRAGVPERDLVAVHHRVSS
jgi:hypothetical protein